MVAAALLFGVSMSAQDLSYEATVGLGFSSYSDGASYNATGFRVGGLAQYAIPQVENLYANAGLMLSLEGAVLPEAGGYKMGINPYFLNIPIHVGYKYDVLDWLGVFGEAGPYLGVGLFGNMYSKYDGEKETEPVFGGDYAMLSRFQFGIGFKIGVIALEHYKLSFGWDWNFLNSAAADTDLNLSHGNGYLAISYVF